MSRTGDREQLCWLSWLWGADVRAKAGCDWLPRSAIYPASQTGWCCGMVSGFWVRCSALWLGVESRDYFHFTHNRHYTYFIAFSYSDINHQRQMLIHFYIKKSLLKDRKDIVVIKSAFILKIQPTEQNIQTLSLFEIIFGQQMTDVCCCCIYPFF